MTNYTNEQLYNALKLIQDICKDNNNCPSCLFYNDLELCPIKDCPPADWDIVKPNEYKPFR